MAQEDEAFAEALSRGDYLIPDGASIVKACRWLKAKNQPEERIAGWDLFAFEMRRLNDKGKMTNDKLRVMFLGSSEEVLALIRIRAAVDYPHLDVITYSPPFKPEFSDEDNLAMIGAINHADPDLLWIGMTAPKQEKWAYRLWDELNIHCHCGTVGAVFDFYAGTVKRAPLSWQRHSLEWLYRLIMEPRRMWRRYIIGAAKFLYYISKEFINSLKL
jgi:N-acetylglucosaminyldiphosphoundecaprenol N-acetyl-beta-D-mannosaminyltransferase